MSNRKKQLAACEGSVKKVSEAFRKLGRAHNECADQCQEALKEVGRVLDDCNRTSKYAWAITKDHLADAPGEEPGSCMNAVGVIGPSNSPLDFTDIIKHCNRQHFRMRDDDDELYYEGYYVCLDEDFGDQFAPLDDFGHPNAGAVHIAYRQEDGTFKDL